MCDCKTEEVLYRKKEEKKQTYCTEEAENK